MSRNYAGGGLTSTVGHSATATATTVDIRAAFRLIDDDLEDLDTTSHSYQYNEWRQLRPAQPGRSPTTL